MKLFSSLCPTSGSEVGRRGRSKRDCSDLLGGWPLKKKKKKKCKDSVPAREIREEFVEKTIAK